MLHRTKQNKVISWSENRMSLVWLITIEQNLASKDISSMFMGRLDTIWSLQHKVAVLVSEILAAQTWLLSVFDLFFLLLRTAILPQSQQNRMSDAVQWKTNYDHTSHIYVTYSVTVSQKSSLPVSDWVILAQLNITLTLAASTPYE